MAKRVAKPRVARHVTVDSLSLQNKNGDIVAILRTNEATGLPEFLMLDGEVPRIFIGFDAEGTAKIEVRCAEGCHRAGMAASKSSGASLSVSTTVEARQVKVELRDGGMTRTITVPTGGDGGSKTTVQYSVLKDGDPGRRMDHPLVDQ